MKYTVAKNFTWPNGQNFELWAKLETPQGTFYLAPEFPEHATKTAAGCVGQQMPCNSSKSFASVGCCQCTYTCLVKKRTAGDVLLDRVTCWTMGLCKHCLAGGRGLGTARSMPLPG